MASVDQSKTTWIKVGDVVNGKKVTKGYLALRSDKSKPFTGTVTGIKSGTTTTGTKNKGQTSVAVYTGGRNVAATTKRGQMKSGSSAAAGMIPKGAGGTPNTKGGAKPTPKKSPAAGGGKGYGLGAVGKGTGPAKATGSKPAAKPSMSNAASTKAKEDLNKKAKDALFNKNMKSKNIGYTPGKKK
jgi:hypothetical protein